MRQLRIAVIGCGRMGRERLRTAMAWGASIAGVHDVNPVQAEAAAAAAGVPSISDIDDVGALGCDALFLCTPPDRRTVYALSAIRARCPFFVEKPIGPSAAAVRRITEELEQRPLLTAVGYMNRYRTSVRQAVRTVSERDVIGVAGFWVCRSYAVPWWLDESASGGPHNEQATHLYDLCRYLIGEVQDVTSLFHEPARDTPPLAAATAVRFESGATGTLFYSCQANAKDIGLRVFTTAGTLFLSGWDLQLTENTIDGMFPDGTEAQDIFLSETTAFLDAVATGDPAGVKSDWMDAVRTQTLVDRAAASLRRGTASAR
jgi:myo-inositol 2-dehydrogenase / D-chiro-inositol 1-dehydrogenase